MTEEYDVVVAGGGSGGIGAALAAARAGLRVLLVEAGPTLGGTAVLAGVSTWEMGVGGSGIPFEIYRRLRRQPDAAWIYRYGRHSLWEAPDGQLHFPGGEQLVWPEGRYLDSMRRYGARAMRDDEAFVRATWHGVPFEPAAYADVVTALLKETGRCTVRTGTKIIDAQTRDGIVLSVALSEGSQVSATTAVDATGDAVLARACGCEIRFGQESRATFGEPDAPEEPTRRLNGASLIYRVTPKSEAAIDPLPGNVPPGCWWSPAFPVAVYTHTPQGDMMVNPLPTMDGFEAFSLGARAAHEECRLRVLAHWHNVQSTFPEMQGYRLSWIAPALGMRETYRIAGEAVLTEHDLLQGISRQGHPDIIALADHAMDTHGAGAGRPGCGELTEPYGIPFRCLVPRGFRNLLVACRAASFSAIAASSCRLSRTMMGLGQAAGTAAVLAQRSGVDAASVDWEELRDALRAQHIQLDHPMPPELKTYLAQENGRSS